MKSDIKKKKIWKTLVSALDEKIAVAVCGSSMTGKIILQKHSGMSVCEAGPQIYYMLKYGLEGYTGPDSCCGNVGGWQCIPRPYHD